jgi:hypothetical protein
MIRLVLVRTLRSWRDRDSADCTTATISLRKIIDT